MIEISEKTRMSSVCRVCLAAGNTTMYSLKNNQLIDVYEKLANKKFNSEDARPRVLCCYCYRKLLRCHNFSQMAHRSEQLFSHLYNKDVEATHEYNTKVNIEIKQQLSYAAMRLITIDGNITDGDSQMTIEEEPIGEMSIDIKEEMITDQNNLVQADSVLEDCTISQLSLEESEREEVGDLPSSSHVKETLPDEDDSNMKFICNNCNFISFSKSKLVSHLRNSHSQIKGKQYTEKTSMKDKSKTFKLKKKTFHKSSNKLFACDVCDNFFYQKYNLVQHMRIHTGGTLFSCDICDKRFNKKSILVRHVRIHTGGKPFSCDTCDKRFNQKNHLLRHVRIHTGGKPFSCDICDKKFNQKNHLLRHVRIHTAGKPFSCDICYKRFNQKSHCLRHLRIHTGRKPFSCDICDKRFNLKHNLVVHMKVHRKPFACKICDQQFNQKGQLVSHMRIHTEEKPFACNVCDQKFRDIDTLAIHVRIHTEDKPFACNACYRQFPSKSSLIGHMRIHTGEKPFACNVCDKRFNQKCHLVIHMRIHTEEKPFACNVCDKQFRHQNSFRNHMKIHT